MSQAITSKYKISFLETKSSLNRFIFVEASSQPFRKTIKFQQQNKQMLRKLKVSDDRRICKTKLKLLLLTKLLWTNQWRHVGRPEEEEEQQQINSVQKFL